MQNITVMSTLSVVVVNFTKLTGQNVNNCV